MAAALPPADNLSHLNRDSGTRGFCEVRGAQLRALRERTSLKIPWGG
jgi:hypothetical protein